MTALQVDLRSDTLTRPTPAMREAIAAAEVGDDVYGEDPTVNRLEARCAALSGKAAALFVPSGTMANLIACRCHTRPGDELVIEASSHLYRYEAAGFAAIAGVSAALVEGHGGLLQPDRVRAALRPEDVHQPRTQLLCLENTHNFAGGTLYSLPQLVALAGLARAEGLRVHVDGARVWNACVAGGYRLAEVGQHVDSMAFCFSKGLGCPVGSMLVGDTPLIARARRLRKQQGGAMRQAGILAAAALYALDHHVARLADDHRRAQALADAASTVPGVTPEQPQVPTNIVFLDSSNHPKPASALVAGWAAQGVHALAVGPARIRMVTHLDVDDRGLEHAVSVLRSTAAA